LVFGLRLGSDLVMIRFRLMVWVRVGIGIGTRYIGLGVVPHPCASHALQIAALYGGDFGFF